MIHKDCAYYKCHKELQSCLFCYCPIYPCKISKLGSWVVIEGKTTKIWDCSDCNMIHNKKIVGKIKKAIRRIIEDSV